MGQRLLPRKPSFSTPLILENKVVIKLAIHKKKVKEIGVIIVLYYIRDDVLLRFVPCCEEGVEGVPECLLE
jgi:hypothetical protein